MNFFTASNITAGYGKQPIVKNVSFELPGGRLMGILGANGSGKTTLLKALCGILPHEGSCLLEGIRMECLSARRIAQMCSYIPQRSGITIDLSALDAVLMGFNPRLKLLEHPTETMKKEARSALETVGLAGMEDMNYLHLSEGQKQLCILARTLVADSRLLLLDEPESALDFHFRYRMLDIIRSWIGSRTRSAMVALHDPMLALNCCDELLLLKDGCVLGMLHPAADPLDRTESQLSQIYGPVELTVCRDRNSRQHIVMLRE